MLHHTIIFTLWVLGSVACASQVISSDSIIVATPVTGVITSECQWAVDVVSSAGFEPGDRVLLHQAKGATCAQDLASDSGSVLSVGYAGAFTFNWVRGIVRNRILLSDSIGLPFQVEHGVQIVKVIRGTNLRIGATIRPRPWDGASGGVVAIEASSSIEFGASRIDAMGRGFRGGDMSKDNTTCTPGTAMHAPSPSNAYGTKGESIAAPRAGAEAGRAAGATGGGGGGNHNSGGGGGGNAGVGGRGGIHWRGCSGINNTYGLGGDRTIMDPSDPRLWFGGGGGGAHQDEARLGTAGAPGGGAIIICAPRIQLDDGTLITAAGATVTDIAAHNGAAGGGGGGTILLLCNVLNGTGRLQAYGGGGGFVDRSDPQPCGPGGGGGGGHIATTLSTIRASTQLYVERGAAGENQGYSDERRFWYAEPGMRGVLTTNLQWTVQPPPAPFKLLSDGDRDLGVLPLGSNFTTTFRVWNVGDEPALVTGIFFEEFKLREVSTSPFPPAYLNPGDTMVVVASGTVRGGEEFDALTVDVNRTCGATAYLIAERRWRSTEDATCSARIRIAAEEADVGGQQILHVVLEVDSLLATESTWRLGLLADRRVLHMKGAVVLPRSAGTARILAYREQGDAASLILEGSVVRTPDTVPDTLATISVLGLFGERWTTPVREDPLEPFIWTPACATTVIPDTVNLGEVCATRSLRMVSFDAQPAISVYSVGDRVELRRAGPANEAVVWQIFDLQGALVGSGQLSETSSQITLARGAYVVVFHWGTHRTTTTILH